MGCDYETISKWSKILQFIACGGLIFIGIFRFINPVSLTNPIYYIINIYLILFGILGIGAELGFEIILKQLNLLRYYFGKAFFCVL